MSQSPQQPSLAELSLTDTLAEYRNLLGVKEKLQKVGAQLKRALELSSSYYRC